MNLEQFVKVLKKFYNSHDTNFGGRKLLPNSSLQKLADNILANAQIRPKIYSKASEVSAFFSPNKKSLTEMFIMISLCNLSSHTISLVTISCDYWLYVHHMQRSYQYEATSVEPMCSVEAMVCGYNSTRMLLMHLLMKF